MEFMISEKGKQLIIYCGYKFYKEHETGDGWKWRCIGRKCTAKLYLDSNSTVIVKSDLNHNHEPPANLDRQRISNYLKRKNCDEWTEKPSKLIRKQISDALVHQTENLNRTDIEYIRKNMYNERRKQFPPLPKSISGVHEEPVLEFVGFDALDDISPGDDSPPTPQELIAPENKLELTAQEYKPDPSPHESKLKAALTKRKQPMEGQQLGNQSPADQASTTSKNDDEDECDLYGKLIAKKLRKMPEEQRERLMYEIQGLFLKATQFRSTS